MGMMQALQGLRRGQRPRGGTMDEAVWGRQVRYRSAGTYGREEADTERPLLRTRGIEVDGTQGMMCFGPNLFGGQWYLADPQRG
jgi:hypothetical protein